MNWDLEVAELAAEVEVVVEWDEQAEVNTKKEMTKKEKIDSIVFA